VPTGDTGYGALIIIAPSSLNVAGPLNIFRKSATVEKLDKNRRNVRRTFSLKQSSRSSRSAVLLCSLTKKQTLIMLLVLVDNLLTCAKLLMPY